MTASRWYHRGRLRLGVPMLRAGATFLGTLHERRLFALAGVAVRRGNALVVKP